MVRPDVSVSTWNRGETFGSMGDCGHRWEGPAGPVTLPREAVLCSPLMPRTYRAMTPDHADPDRPAIGRSARMLGIRPPPGGNDVHPDDRGNVGPICEGMSVAPSVATLPHHRCPPRLRHLHPGAEGKDADRVFAMGEGPFQAGIVASGLKLCPDKPNPTSGIIEHGVVEPDAETPLTDYERRLAETQGTWRIDET